MPRLLSVPSILNFKKILSLFFVNLIHSELSWPLRCLVSVTVALVSWWSLVWPLCSVIWCLLPTQSLLLNIFFHVVDNFFIIFKIVSSIMLIWTFNPCWFFGWLNLWNDIAELTILHTFVKSIPFCSRGLIIKGRVFFWDNRVWSIFHIFFIIT